MKQLLLTASTLTLLATYCQAAPASYAARVLADRPFGYWRLGEARGSAVANDASGHGNNGHYHNVTLGQPGIGGGDTAALFGPLDGRVVVPNSLTLNPHTITMEAMIVWKGTNGLQQRILEKSSYAELAQYGLNVLDDGHVLVQIRTVASGTNDLDAKSTGVVALGKRTHIVATYDGRTVRIYLNGILDSQTRVANPGSLSPKPPPSGGSDLGIGNQANYTPPRDRPFNGVIDEVALYDHALTAQQVQTHFRQRRPSRPPIH
jgi:hypothetical protein